MPTVRVDDATPVALASHGPGIFVRISFDPNHFGIDGPHVPQSEHLALIDTGASRECIDIALAQKLGLPQRGTVEVAGAAGLRTHPTYLAQFDVPVLQKTIHGIVYGLDLQGGGLRHVAVIGRRLLQNYIMTYNGIEGSVTFEW